MKIVELLIDVFIVLMDIITVNKYYNCEEIP